MSDRFTDLGARRRGCRYPNRQAVRHEPDRAAHRPQRLAFRVAAPEPIWPRRDEPHDPQGSAAARLHRLHAACDGKRLALLTGPSGTDAVRVQGLFRANNADAVRQAALAGLGIAVVPTWLVANDLAAGTLRRLLPGLDADREWT